MPPAAIPELHLADDASVLVLDRFDLKADGTYMGFEDACALLEHSSSEKYEDSYEIRASKLFAVLRGNAQDMRQFFKSITLSMMVRNGDAHLKNFGVLYDDPTKAIRLAPCYDVVTTTAIYVPNEDPALTIEWRKRWLDKKTLLKYPRRDSRERSSASSLRWSTLTMASSDDIMVREIRTAQSGRSFQ